MAVSFLYLGNLFLRIGHNVVFAFLSPRDRVLVSVCSMAISMSVLISTLVFDIQTLTVVFIAYFLGGVSIGSFEANFLNCCTPLGHNSKLWALLGMPLGIMTMTIGSFAAMEMGAKLLYFYIFILTACITSIPIFFIRIYRMASLVQAVSFSSFVQDLRQFRLWWPKVWKHSVVLMVDMFCVSLMSPGIVLYLYNDDPVRTQYFFKGFRIHKDIFFMFYNMGFSLGDFCGRRFFFHIKSIHPAFFLIFSAIGAVCALGGVTVLVPIGGFFVALGNGSVYSQTCRLIDRVVPSSFNLIALSSWLFVGDIGSVVGSNTIPYLKRFMDSEGLSY